MQTDFFIICTVSLILIKIRTNFSQKLAFDLLDISVRKLVDEKFGLWSLKLENCTKKNKTNQKMFDWLVRYQCYTVKYLKRLNY